MVKHAFPPTEAAPSSKTGAVLIVDDNVDSADSLSLLLQLKGYETYAAYSGADALAQVAALKPRVVLLDIGLPGMDGYEIAQAITRRMGDCAPVLVAVTGYGRDEDLRRAKAAGFQDHLLKPVTLDRVEQILQSVGE